MADKRNTGAKPRSVKDFRDVANTLRIAAGIIDGIANEMDAANCNSVTVSVAQLFNTYQKGVLNAAMQAASKVSGKLTRARIDKLFETEMNRAETHAVSEEMGRAELDAVALNPNVRPARPDRGVSQAGSREAESQPEPKTKPARKGKGAK